MAYFEKKKDKERQPILNEVQTTKLEPTFNISELHISW
jgi:hypothetical protein